MEQTSVANLETKDSLDDSDYLVVDDLTTTKKILARQLLADCLYPVGSIYMSVNSTSPAKLFGGTWEQIKDTFLLGSGSYTLGDTGGEKTHTLSESELPAISGSMNFTNEADGSNVWKIYGHITGTKIEKKYQYGNAITGSAYSYTKVGFSFGESQAHNNMPPYLVVNIWKRIK